MGDPCGLRFEFFLQCEVDEARATVMKSEISQKEKDKYRILTHIYCCCSSLLSRVWLFATPGTAANKAPLSSTVSQNVLKLRSILSR